MHGLIVCLAQQEQGPSLARRRRQKLVPEQRRLRRHNCTYKTTKSKLNTNGLTRSSLSITEAISAITVQFFPRLGEPLCVPGVGLVGFRVDPYKCT